MTINVVTTSDTRPRWTPLSISFLGLHIICLAVFWTPFAWPLLVGLVFSYAIRMFAITAGYHRYFSHRTFKLNRLSQFLLAFVAQTSAQKGILWWASHHRNHHRFSDQHEDIHSPLAKGFWYAHVGWILSDAHEAYDSKNIQDFEKYPELRWLNTYHWVCPLSLGIATFLLGYATGLGAWATLLWFFVLPTVLLFHGTFTINSLCHLWGSVRFSTGDGSRNNFILAFLTLGEGWHNNHHHFQNGCRQGIRWWEWDPTFYILKVFSWLSIVQDIRPWPPEKLLARKDSSFSSDLS
jgi:stearoyl-CoA desaturase (delta-9 desaturase)